ncbi:MAG: hypothetical protein H6832_02105 [Planctomycetes bacterium]|nr:hypothetical protein [Planctomycetota bacterium]MCB9917182.1 hypothetical protein [Planctomycetota bacterium]
MLSVLLEYTPWLALTLALEGAVVALLIRGEGRRRALQACIAINLLTHPIATLAVLEAGLNVVPVELVVIAVEVVLYRQILGLSTKRAITLGVLANLVSWGAGVAASLVLETWH